MVPHLPSLLAFSALFFFGPVVKKKLSDYESMLTSEEMEFVLSYCRLGTLLLGCWLWGFVLSVLLPAWSSAFMLVSIVLPGLMIAIMGRAGYRILQGQQWTWFGGWRLPVGVTSIPTQGDPLRIITDFLPGWSVWQRYVHWYWKTNYRWTKEAMLLRTVWAVQHLAIGSSLLSGFVFFLILARVATLRANLDFVPQQWKQAINMVVRTSVFDVFLYVSRWIQGRIMRFLHHSSLGREDNVVVCADEPRPRGWWLPHVIMIVCCLWWLGLHWMLVSLSLWGVATHATTIAWLLVLIHPCAVLKAGLWFPLFHQWVERWWSVIQKIISLRKKNIDHDERV